MYVCVCNAVSDRAINSAIEAGAHSFEELMDQLGVAMGCGSCEREARRLLAVRLRALGHDALLSGVAA